MNISSANRDMKKAFHESGFTGKDCVIALLDTAVGDVGKMKNHIVHTDSYRIDDKNNQDHGSFIANMLFEWAPDATILSYCVFPNGEGKMTLTNQALEDVISRAKADPGRQYFVNMSLASNLGKNVVSPTIAKMHTLIQQCNAARIPVYVASGNDGSEQLYIYPSRFEEPVCICAANSNGSVASFSTFHDETDFLEAGVDILGINRYGIPTFMSGTSMACPNALGKAVLLACKMREDTGSWPTEMQLYNESKACAIDCETVGYDKKSGFGFIDIRKSDGIYKHVESTEKPITWKDSVSNVILIFKTLLKNSGMYPADEVSDAPYSRVLKYGMEGADVKKVKDKLLELGYLSSSTKYTFGGDTRTAVKKFQADHGLEIDGKVGPITWNALFNVVAPSEEEGEPLPDTEFDLSLIPPNISRAKAIKIAKDLACVSEVRRAIVLDALQFAVDPDNVPQFMLSFYGRGKNLYNNDLSLNVATKSKMDSYFRNSNYAPYYDGGRQQEMEATAIASNYTTPWSDCSGEIVGLSKRWCADYIDGVKKLVSSGFDANANTLISRYANKTDNPKPGDWAWRDGHIGLYAGGAIVVEHVGGAYGCAASIVSNRRVYSFTDGRTHKMGGWTSFGSPVFYD